MNNLLNNIGSAIEIIDNNVDGLKDFLKGCDINIISIDYNCINVGQGLCLHIPRLKFFELYDILKIDYNVKIRLEYVGESGVYLILDLPQNIKFFSLA